MYKFIIVSLFVFLLSSILFSQDLSRLQKIEKLKELNIKVVKSEFEDTQSESERDKLLDDIVSVDGFDVVKAGRLNVEYERLFPDGELDLEGLERTSFSKYWFAEHFNYPSSPAMIFQNGNLEMVVDKESKIKSYGLIANIGGTLLETIDLQNKAVEAINKFKAPAKTYDFTGEFDSDGVTFSTKANVTVGNTYIVRVFQHKLKDAIYALRVRKKDEDGSIVIFIKLIKNSTPEIDDGTKKILDKFVSYDKSDAELYTNIMNIMNQKGFYNVRLEIKDGIVKIHGSVPRGKMAEAILSAMEAKPKKIENQLTEEKN